VGFDGGDEIERVVRKRELRDRAGANFDSPEFYPACAGFLRCDDALFGIINAVNFSLGGPRRQLVDRPTAATTYIQDCVVLLNGNAR
jgi:hypothetical protein